MSENHLSNENKNLISLDIENQISMLMNIDWFCGVLNRKDAEKKILNNRDFLLRLSNGSENNFVVSTKWNEKYLHVIIKNEIDVYKKQVTYHIVPKYRFGTIIDLINFHITKQHPLSSTNAVICHGVSFSNATKKEHKFKKGARTSTKIQDKIMPRSGSVVMLGSQRPFSAFSEMNKSLTELSTTAVDGPTKPSKRGFLSLANKIFQPRKGKIKNGKHEKENSDYNNEIDVISRDNFRRGQSLDFLATSLLNADYNTVKDSCEKVSVASRLHASTRRYKDNKGSSVRMKKKSSSVFLEQNRASYSSDSMVESGKDSFIGDSYSVYVDPVNIDEDSQATNFLQTSNSHDELQDSEEVITLKRPLKRGGSSIYVVPNTIQDHESIEASVPGRHLKRGGSSIYVLPINNGETACNITRKESLYVVPLTPTTVNQSSEDSQPLPITIGSFLNLELSRMPLSYCGPIEGTFDTSAINTVSLCLLSDPLHPLSLCAHLLEEIRRIFRLVSPNIAPFKSGYRCLFLNDSGKCQRDFSIRQSALTCFVMATIVCVSSSEIQSQMIVFWIQCANILLSQTRDMFHFRSVVTAIFSDHISRLDNVWISVYDHRPEIIEQVNSLRTAISQGCFMRTEIDQCLPDIIQLYRTFTNDDDDEDDFNEFCRVSVDIMHWTAQSFSEIETWLMKINADLEYITPVPMWRELVRTETLLSLILGRITVSSSDVDPLLHKVEDCIAAMASAKTQT